MICVAATLVSTVCRYHGGLRLLAFDFRCSGRSLRPILFGQVFPWIVLINPLFVAFATVRLTNSYVGMILTYTAFTHARSRSTCWSATW